VDREGILLVRSAMWGPGGPSIRSSICSKLFQILRSSIFENYHKSRMPESRRHERPRSFHLDHSASFRATKPNKASMSLMLAAASICTTDMLERHLAPPGFERCERERASGKMKRVPGSRAGFHAGYVAGGAIFHGSSTDRPTTETTTSALDLGPSNNRKTALVGPGLTG